LRRDSLWAFIAGILLTIVLLLVVEESFIPQDVSLTMIPLGAFIVFLWLNAYRVSWKRKTT
jgi:heme/copper-type cytochrome/quinol oxidase subunit 4